LESQEKGRKQISKWLAKLWPRNWEGWVAVGLIVVAGALEIAILLGKIDLYGGDEADRANRFFLLSTLSATLAAILAIALTAILVVTQLAAETYTPKIIHYRLRDPWLWGVLAFYLIPICLALAGVAESKALERHVSWDWQIVDSAILLSAAALAYLVPFTAATLRGLDRDDFIRRLLAENEYEGLQDLMRKAVNEGMVQQVEAAMGMLIAHALVPLAGTKGSAGEARNLAEQGVRLGKYACAKKDPETIVVVFKYLTEMTSSCTKRTYRGAADIFNESVYELQSDAEEAFSTGMETSTLAELHERAGNSYLKIAQVKAKDREENLKRAISSLDRALEFFTSRKYGVRAASIQDRLGVAYCDLAEVRDKEANLKLAFDAYEQALRVRTFEEFPQDYATTQKNLGKALRGRAGVREKEANLKLAFAAVEQALRVFKFEAFPQDYAATQNSLGAAYQNLAEVRDPEANLKRAIAAYEQALRVYTFEALPQDYAGTQNNLGNAYQNLAEVREREADQKRAIAAYEQALRVFTFEAFPQDYAMTQNNLGAAYQNLAEVRESDANLKRSIDAFEQALSIYTFEAFPQDYAMTQNNLGNAYGILAEVRDKENNLKRAIAAHGQALRVRTFESFPQDYAMTQNNLGNAYGILAEVRDRENNLDRAIAAFEEALRVYTTEDFPERHSIVERGLEAAKAALEAARGGK
jgi:tetratricopeptide (TPR) repeat protein